MKHCVKRWLATGLGAVTLMGAGLMGLSNSLPDTFSVSQGQTLQLAQLPWLVPLRASGVQETSRAESGSSYNVTLSILGIIPVKTVRAMVVQERTVTICGTPFGIKMFSEGAMVVGFTDVSQLVGSANPAKAAGLKLGDRILALNGVETSTNEDVAKVIQSSQGQPVEVTYHRDGQIKHTILSPLQDHQSKRWLAGMWVRDSSAGIGTLTFVDNSTGMYGGLGHAISDADTGESIALRTGEISPVTITGVVLGTAGTPGELKGQFSGALSLGNILSNGASGVYGRYYSVADGQDYPVANAQQVHKGEALILTTIQGETPQMYQAVIERVSLSEEDPNRNMVIRITDQRLLSATGGIVQGMSGSPVIQDGRWVGAVTHVLVNDPTRGYGIFAEHMLSTADYAASSQNQE